MKRLFFTILFIAILGYGVYILINYVQLIMKKKGLEEKVKECVEYLHTGTFSIDKLKRDLITHIEEQNINVDTMEIKIEKNPQFTYIYLFYYDSLIFPFYKKSKVIYFDFEIAETLFAK